MTSASSMSGGRLRHTAGIYGGVRGARAEQPVEEPRRILQGELDGGS